MGNLHYTPEEMNKFIPVNEPDIGFREKELINECLDTGWISSEGPFVNKFEVEMSKKVNRKYGIACSNGSAALDIAVRALNIGPGDEVIMPTFTIISCATAIINSGAKPILVDADPETWNMQVENIEALITKNTVAIMAVHIYGLPVYLDPIIKIAEKYHLAIIEDSAELIGGKYKNKPCGSFGTVSTFSFYSNKHITTGEGGMILTNDFALAERCKSLRNLCFKPNNRFVHDEIGWNYRMTNLQAALGIAQLEKLEKSIDKKLQIGEKYLKEIKNINLINTQQLKTDYAFNIFWVFGILVDKDFSIAKTIIEELYKRKIGARPFFYPMHKQPVFNELGLFLNDHHPVSEDLYKQGLYLPSGLKLKNSDIEIVCKHLRSIFS